MFQIDSSLIHELEENERHIVALDERGEEKMTVTVIDANHCPGAVMYLFDGYFGRVLYTGDFRYEPWMSVDTPLVDVTDIDVLYLDNTYNCSACCFPARSVATTMVCDVIRRHKQKDVVIGVHNLGKEDLLEHIAETFHRWIAVSPEFYKKCTALQRRNVFTTDVESTSIRVVRIHEVTRARLNLWNKKQPTIAILPTALYFAGGSIATSADMFVVPYSDHSSYTELVAFVEHVKPRLVIPIVRKMSNAENLNMGGITDVGNFSRYLDVTVSRLYQVPDSVTEWMKLARHNSVRLRKNRMLSKKTVRRRKRLKEVEFTDESPVKSKRISPTTELQQARDQSYDGRVLICVGHVRSVNKKLPLHKRKLPLSFVIDGNVKRSKVKLSERELSDKDNILSPCHSSLTDTNTDVDINVVETEDNILSPFQKAPTENNVVLSQCHISDVTSDGGDCTMDRLHTRDTDRVCEKTAIKVEPESSRVKSRGDIEITVQQRRVHDVIVVNKTMDRLHTRDTDHVCEKTAIKVEPESSRVKSRGDIEITVQQLRVHDVVAVNNRRQEQSGNLHDTVACAETLADTPPLTGGCTQHTSRDNSTTGSPRAVSQLDVSQHAQTSGVSRTETLATKTAGDILTQAQQTHTSGDAWARSQDSEISDDICTEIQNTEVFFDARTESQNTELFFDALTESLNTQTTSATRIETQNTETLCDTRIKTQNTETSNGTRVETQNTETLCDTRIETQNTETLCDTRKVSQNTQTRSDARTVLQNTEKPCDPRTVSLNTETPCDTRTVSQNTETRSDARTVSQNTETPCDTLTETQNTETFSDTRIETQSTGTQTSETFSDTCTAAKHDETFGDTRTKAQQFIQNSQRTTGGVTNFYHRRHSSVAGMGPATPRLLFSPNNGNASTPHSAMRTKHKLGRTCGSHNIIGSSAFETDPDSTMRLIDPLLDKEAKRMSAGHSWVTQT